jgi:hypothetical protein
VKFALVTRGVKPLCDELLACLLFYKVQLLYFLEVTKQKASSGSLRVERAESKCDTMEGDIESAVLLIPISEL